MILQNSKDSRVRKYIFSNSLLEVYNDYSKSLDELDITEATKEWRLKHIRGFLHTLEHQGIKFKQLKKEDVYDYLNSITHLKARTKEHRAVCIRLFLDWLYENGIIDFQGSMILRNIKCNKNEQLITYYDDNEITTMINAVDTEKKNGKRDLAIMLLFSYLGIRSKDVIDLKYQDIKWNENRITFVHSKNNEINSFFMPEQLRYALIDYLKNERPESNLENIFIDDDGNKLDDHKIYRTVNKYFDLAKINTENKKHGSHSLRHSLATSLLNQNKSIYEISNILGHKNINDTIVYLRVDLKLLRKISLEVPEWKN